MATAVPAGGDRTRFGTLERAAWRGSLSDEPWAWRRPYQENAPTLNAPRYILKTMDANKNPTGVMGPRIEIADVRVGRQSRPCPHSP